MFTAPTDTRMSANDLSPTQPKNADADLVAIEAFVERWRPAQAAELANAQPLLTELAALLCIPGPTQQRRTHASTATSSSGPATAKAQRARRVGAATSTVAATSCWRRSRELTPTTQPAMPARARAVRLSTAAAGCQRGTAAADAPRSCINLLLPTNLYCQSKIRAATEGSRWRPCSKRLLMTTTSHTTHERHHVGAQPC